MIVASLLLVIAAAVTLLIGLFNRETLEWVYASIACCLLAGLLLTIGVLRSRPSRKPVLQSGGEGQGASWAGAASQWGDGGGSGSDSDSDSDVLTRDDDTEMQPAAGSEDPTQTSLATVPADDAAQWAPPSDDDTADVRLVPPPGADEPAPAARTEEPAPAAETPPAEDDVVVVPKPSARKDAPAASDDTPVTSVDAKTPAAAPAAAAARRRSAAAAPGGEDAARFEQVLSPIPGVGPAKRAALLDHFGTYRKLRSASVEKLAAVPGISRTLADRIHKALHS